MVSQADYHGLIQHVDGISLMTYDYSNPIRYIAGFNTCRWYKSHDLRLLQPHQVYSRV